jgi:hypothetical protein
LSSPTCSSSVAPIPPARAKLQKLLRRAMVRGPGESVPEVTRLINNHTSAQPCSDGYSRR